MTRSERPQPKLALAFSRADLLIALGAIALLAALVWPALALGKAKTHRARCLNNLKEVASGCRVWANANSGKFPWGVASTNGGSLGATDWAAHYRACSNELRTPRILVCPSDRQKTIAGNWAALDGERHVSFFAGLDAEESKPQTIVAGDRNVHGGGQGLDRAWSRDMGVSIDAAWLNTIHVNQGQLALADGSVHETKTSTLREQISAALQSGSPAVTFSLPRAHSDTPYQR